MSTILHKISSRLTQRIVNCALSALHCALSALHCALSALHCALSALHCASRLFTIHYSLFTIHSPASPCASLLFTIHYSLFTIHSPASPCVSRLFTIHYSLFTIHSPASPLRQPIIHYSLFTIHYSLALLLLSCSSTSNLGQGEQLYTGLKPIDYQNYEKNDHQVMTQAELDAALATAPNGALFGSSYYRTPFPYGLWVWNACNGSSGVIKKWLNKSFGKAPVLMSNVNPPLRISVAENVLQNHGYFTGKVTYDVLPGKEERTKNDTTLMPRTAKIQYHVNFGPLYTIDSVTYTNYPDEILKMVKGSDCLLRKGDAFDVSTLDSERTRIYNRLRNHGYYYYQPSYTSYLADTLQTKQKAQVQVHLADSLPDDALRKWVIGSTTVQVKRQLTEQLTDSLHRRYLTIWYGGKKPPLRPGVVLRDMRLRPGDVFSQDAYQESLNNMASKGIFSSADITFKPRYRGDTLVTVPDTIGSTKAGDTRAGAGVMDMTVNAILDKPWDFTFMASAKGKTNSRLGPGLTLGLTRYNAFRGGEQLSATIGANYEFQTGGGMNMGNSYDFTAGLSLNMPRLWVPNFIRNKTRRRWYTSPSTVVSVTGEIIRRAGFFTRNVLAGEIDYIFQPTETSIHEFSPLVLTYARTYNKTSEYETKIDNSVYGTAATEDVMIPRIRYKYTYTSPQSYHNPIYWQNTFTEAGNIYNLISMAIHNCGWNNKGRTLFKTEFDQFLKYETDFRKTWAIGEKSTLVAHFNGGYIYSLGNSDEASLVELFYIGGANDLRGFSMRSLGPGSFHIPGTQYGYLYHNGNLKLIANVEYRPHLFGSLYGAMFLDAGNVWNLDNVAYDIMKEEEPLIGDSKKIDVGMDVGVGLRYDLDYFVLRLDWGFAFHAPYRTKYSGFFNMRNFNDMQCLTFAIGYPF